MTSKQLLSKLKHDKAYTEYIESLEKDLNELERLREDSNEEVINGSLKAFDRLIDLLNRYQHTIPKDNERQTIDGYPIDNIRKDLEVLVVLKKHLSIKDYNPVAYPSFVILSGGPIDDLEEARKIKEWLENE